MGLPSRCEPRTYVLLVDLPLALHWAATAHPRYTDNSWLSSNGSPKPLYINPETFPQGHSPLLSQAYTLVAVNSNLFSSESILHNIPGITLPSCFISPLSLQTAMKVKLAGVKGFTGKLLVEQVQALLTFFRPQSLKTCTVLSNGSRDFYLLASNSVKKPRL